jgi:hypothetical protein
MNKLVKMISKLPTENADIASWRAPVKKNVNKRKSNISMSNPTEKKTCAYTLK